jgi:uncharacterized protein YbjT (DUF2867 family)
MTNTEHPFLILGGTGKTGSRVIDRLRHRGLPVRAGSRSGDPAFDWADRSTWAPALGGTRAAYLSYYPDLAVPDAAADIAAFTELAGQAGVRRLVLLSGRGEEGAEKAEQALRESTAEWTILRCAWFDQNFTEGYLLDPVREGAVALPVGSVREPFLDVDDIADTAVAALTEDGHAGELYELTGPRLLSFADAAAEIGAAARRPVDFVTVPIEDYAAALTAAQLPADAVELISYLFTDVLDGRNASLGDGVRRALGREPRDFADWAREAAATGVWNPA